MGQARVTDFGLAVQSEEVGEASTIQDPFETRIDSNEQAPGAQVPTKSTNPLGMPLTRRGAILGTPAYMAPEQFVGNKTDARSDQFSFAVALWEALHGEQPFGGDTLSARKENMLAARIKEPPSHSKVPAWVQAALCRALAPDPDDRYPSLSALLATLGRDSTQSLRWQIATVALVLLVAVSGLLSYVIGREQNPHLCIGGPEKLAGIWDSPRQQAIEEAFLSTNLGYGRDTWIRVRGALDTYTAEWLGMYRDTCEATRVRGEQSEDIMSLRMACLEGRRQELAVLTEVFASADGNVVEKAISAASSLRRLGACADVEALMAELKPPEEANTRQAVETARIQLARIKVLTEAGKYQVALKLAAEVTDKTSTLGYKPIHAEALVTQAWAQLLSGETKNIPKLLTQALWLAHASRHDTVVTAASVRLMGYYSSHGPSEEAQRWERFSEAWLDRLNEKGELRAIFYNNRGLALYLQNQFAEAYDFFDKAYALADKQLGPSNSMTLRYATNSLAALGALDQVDASQRALETLVRTGETNLGPNPPFLAQSLSNLSSIYAFQGRLVDARRLLDRVREIGQQAYGVRSEERAQFHLAYGDLEQSEGHDAEALTHYEETARIYSELTGPESLKVMEAIEKMAEAQASLNRLALAKQNFQWVLDWTKKVPIQSELVAAQAMLGLADLHETLGQDKRALRLRQQVLKAREQLFGPQHIKTRLTRIGVADSLLELGQPARALAIYEQERVPIEKELGTNTPVGVLPLERQAEALLRLGRAPEALPLLEHVIQVVDAHAVRPAYKAAVQFTLANALWAVDQQPERALRLALAARATYAHAHYTHALMKVDAVLKQRGSDVITPQTMNSRH